MDPVKRKVISELFFSPSVVLPIVGGVSAGLLSWAMGGNNFMTAAAAVGVLGGVGWMLTRMIFKIEDITEEALQAELDKRLQQEHRELEELAQKLRSDRDHRTQDFLTLLRSMREEFENTTHRAGSTFRSAQIREQVGLIFKAAVDQLRQSYRLWDLSENLVGSARDKVLADREQVLGEVDATVERLQTTIQQFRDLMNSDPKVDLASMRAELEATMRIAKRTEERMREIENPSANFESFIKE